MYRFQEVRKVGRTLQRGSYGFLLSQSLDELFALYDQLGGPSSAVVKAIEGKVERCLNDLHRPRAQVRERLYVLLRAKDIHRYLIEDEALVPLKTELLEHVLIHRAPEERWAAIRELLISSMDRICGHPGAAGSALFETFKRQASLRTSTLGKLLRTVVLFNFDADEEEPPVNLHLRFVRGEFPNHGWEAVGGKGAAAGPASKLDWNPTNPLCRWEYLAADLGHALFRLGNSHALAARGSEPQSSGRRGIAREPEEQGTLYRAVAGKTSDNGGSDQIELFPLDCRTLMAEISRELHGALGTEAPRLFALLLERLSWSGEGEVLEISPADLAAEPPGSGASAKTIRERSKKLCAIVERLRQVRLVRIATEGAHAGAEATTLFTVLGERTDLPQGSGTRVLPEAAAAHAASPPLAIRFVVDSCFHQSKEGNLGLPYRDLPEQLLCVPSRSHPYAVGLYVFLRRAWRVEWETAGGVILRTARQLLHEAGFTLRENGRYRAIEAMKRDLYFLQEHGWLGGWRLNRGSGRDVLDDMYRLESPVRGEQVEAPFFSPPSDAVASA